MVRSEIIKIIIIELRNIKTGNGFSYNQKPELVFDWIQKKIDEAIEDVIINVQDSTGDTDQTSGSAKNIIEVHISSYKSGITDPDEIRLIMGDILKAMQILESRPGNGIDKIDYRGDVLAFESTSKFIGAADQTFDVYYQTNKWTL